jgi:hypothetical protein
LHSVYFVDDDTGWIVGDGSTIIKTTNGGVTSLESSNDDNSPEVFSLSQNFPNPFNPTTTIRYQVKQKTFVSLKIFNVLGKEVGTLVNGEKLPGEYSIDFNGSNLSSGVYFYQLRTENFIQTRKMILVK